MTEISGITDSVSALPPKQAQADIVGGESAAELSKKSFADYGVSAPIVQALAAHGITHPFPIQALTLPIALKGSDIIGQAKTGTGKTLGFGIPMLESAVGEGERGWEELPHPGLPQGMVIVPTRELAKQVAGDLRAAGANRSLRITEIYGGKAYEPQITALKQGTEIVVGTPGRLIDLKRQHVLRLDCIRTVVLDEADEMLDLGFLESVETLLNATPSTRHTMLFSATMPGAVITMARRYMSKPTHIRAQDPGDDTSTVKTVRQLVYRCHSLNKAEVIARILQARNRGRTIIFCKTKRTTENLRAELKQRGFAVGALHGDLGQPAREQALHAFRKGSIDVLTATDVAARGIDIDDVTHVINYQCPEDEKIYLHRIGRTGRAGHCGTAITFVDWEDTTRWALINRILHLDFPTPTETYHTSEHLYTDLDIPTDVTGRLPGKQPPAEKQGEGRRNPGKKATRGRKRTKLPARGTDTADTRGGEEKRKRRRRRIRKP